MSLSTDLICRSTGHKSLRLIASLQDLGWLSGDVVAGLTVGIVVVPQGMSYAQVRLLSFNVLHFSSDIMGTGICMQIATLPHVYGLYSSVVGVFIYCVR